MMTSTTRGRDSHSYAQPEKVRVTHCSLSLAASFEERSLRGTARLNLERIDSTAPLILDTRALRIESVTCAGTPVEFVLADRDPILGSALSISLPAGADSVEIRYATSQEASGLQWLNPEQTAGKKHPFLFSQSQSIHARSWIPLQDSPGIRFTYDAQIEAPAGLLALMSAREQRHEGTQHSFVMDLAVPAYLIAIAIGELESATVGARTRVYAEPPILAAAAREFEDTETLIQTVEKLYGPYRWGRYDLLILPPSFPFGGMENPCLTFVTPTVIAGDKSLVSLISHELAHSWSGNLVTNATWRDFWLNEGFTTYLENRIQEEVYGLEQALMEQVLDRRDLEKELREFPLPDQILHIDLTGRDPDEGCTHIPYIKGALFLRLMEQTFGRAEFDRFMRAYFDRFAFQSVTTEEALAFLRVELFARFPDKAAAIPVKEWVTQSGLPMAAPRARSPRLEKIAEGTGPSKDWKTQEWLEFLQTLPHPISQATMGEIDAKWNLTNIGNYEILAEWLGLAIRTEYAPAYTRLNQFLHEVGRTRMLRHLYAELQKTESGQQIARAIYTTARRGYHPMAQTVVDKILSRPPAT
jgi:leukotriene-A4 hydrolase